MQQAFESLLQHFATLEKDAYAGDLQEAVCAARLCAGSSETKMRCAAFRLARLVAATPEGVSVLNSKRFHLMTVRSLEREPRFLEERVLALKLVRKMAVVAGQQLPRTLLRSLVAIANHRDDQLKEAAIDSLREISMIDTRAVAECGGMDALVRAVLDPSMENLANSVLLTILFLLNDSATRIWFRPSLDIAALLAPFTSPQVESDDAQAVRKACRRAIVTMMRTWTGLLVLSSDPHGLRSLVQTLVQPVSVELRRDVLETVLEIFNTINPLRAPSFGSAQHHVVAPPGDGAAPVVADDASTDSGVGGSYGAEPYMAGYWGVGPGAAGSKELAAGGFHAERVPGRHAHMHTLLDNYLVMVLLAFVQCGLVEALVELSVTAGPPMARMATQLLSFVSRFSTRLLPGAVSRRLLSQRKLVTSAVDAARAGEVVDRARAQRAAHVISLLSRIVGSGYDTALATLLARSTYEDGVALSSELALAGCSERAHLNLGVFPRSVIVQKSSVHDALVAAAKNLGQDRRIEGGSESQGGGANGTPTHGPSRSGSLRGRLSLTFRGFSRRFTAGGTPLSGNGGGGTVPTTPTDLTGSQADHLDTSALAAPLVANRGHRRLVQQLVLTDLAHGQTSDELKSMLDRARILIKSERRDWSRWDWPVIDQLLSGPLQNPQVCLDVLKTKFFPRLAQFYAVNRNGYFASLPWEPDNVAYTNVASSMLRVLLNVDLPEARDFLAEDRRGRLMAQIAQALLLELRHAEDPEGFANAPTAPPTAAAMAALTKMREHHPAHARGLLAMGSVHAPAPGANNNNNNNNNDDDEDDDLDDAARERVFTPTACAGSMARDFFVLLGVYASHHEGVRHLEKLGVFETLDRLSHYAEKDYVLRLVISHFDFGGPETCRKWLQIRMVDKKISTNLRHFIVGFFRSLLRSAQTQSNDKVASWILEVVFAQLKFSDVLSDALSVLIEATHYPMYLAMMTQMINKELEPYKEIIRSVEARPLLLKFLGNDDGVAVCQNMGWLATVQDEWRKTGFLAYLSRVETTLTVQLASSAELEEARKGRSRPIPVRAHEASALSEPGFTASELQWLFRMPWRVEIWAESSAGQVKLPVDSFIDCSRLRPEDELVSGGKGARSDQGICVVAYPSLKSGEKRVRPLVVPEDATLYACLTIANLPIDRRGRTTPPPRAGGGFPFTNGYSQPFMSGRGEPTDSKDGYAERLRAMTHMSRKPKTQTSSSAAAMRTASGADDSDPDPGESFGGAFVEAAQLSPTEEAVMPLSDGNFWVKCTPQSRLSKEKTFTVVPSEGAAAFNFAPLGEMGSVDKWDDEAVGSAGASAAAANEPPVPAVEAVHRTLNPLLALKASAKSSTALPPPPPKTDFPPPLLLTHVCFNLELVPHRFASPSLPVHLLGELAKTEKGAKAIASMNVLADYVKQIQDESLPSSTRRAALWALGHTGASEHGFRLLNAEHVKAVIHVAVNDATLSLRGTAVYALGLFSRSRLGAKALNDHGWATLDSKTHPFATIAVPASKAALRFYKLDVHASAMDARSGLSAAIDGVSMPVSRDGPLVEVSPDTDAGRVLKAVSELSNHIAQKDAHAVLLRIKESNPGVFNNVQLFMTVQELLARYAYQLQVRQFIAGLFRSLHWDIEANWRKVDDEHLR